MTRTRHPLAAALLLPFAVLATVASADVELKRTGATVRVIANGELFAALQTAESQAKPYLYPVMQPGWSRQPFTAGHFIAVGETMLRDDDGNATGVAIPASTKVTADRRDGDRIHLLAPAVAWVNAGDVVPVSGLAVRVMEDEPIPYDRKNAAVYDHPHHRGIWIAIDEVGHTKFWMERGRIDAVSVDLLEPVGSPAKLRLITRWFDDAEPSRVVLRQGTLFSFHDDGFIDTVTTFTPPEGESATFGDTKEGLIGVRMPDHRREKTDGLIRNADGAVGEDDAWGRPSDWVDYVGPVSGDDGGDAVKPGVSLFAHPSNPRASRYHVRGYGLFSINPFGQKAYSKGEQPADPLTLSGDEMVTLRYGIWIHGDASREDVAARYRQYAGE